MCILKRTIILVTLVATPCLALIIVVDRSTPFVIAQTATTPTAPATQTIFSDTFGFGRPATQEEIAAWDIDARPDGVGLPPGSGSVAEGAKLYAQYCASCHSANGRESSVLLPFRSLVGEYDAKTWPTWPLTIGNYWPYAAPVFDYIRRAMPYTAPGSLSDDEVYAIAAWLLNQNGLIANDAVMDAQSLPEVKMPALQHYVPSDWRDNYPYH
jgi:cytochrome c